MLAKDPVDFLIDVPSDAEIHNMEVWQKAEAVIYFDPKKEFTDRLKKLQEEGVSAHFIFILSGNDAFGKAVDFMQAGGYYCLSLPFDIEKLKEVIGEIRKKIRKESTWKECRSPVYVEGVSAEAKTMHQNVALVASTDYNILLLGESGTGKESIAHMIHDKSSRAAHPFIAIDCGCLTPELAASELFGHEKGAFTGALTAKTGAFEAAASGTLFLDEISNLSFELQALLLRSIQEKAIRPVGSIKEKSVDVRIITASNCDLQLLIKNGTFRQDLFYRLNEFSIHLPALRQRKEDLMQIAYAFKDITASELNKPLGDFTDEVIDIFHQYQWPGNIRELKNIIRRMCLLADPGKVLDAALLPEELITNRFIADMEEEDLKLVSQKAEMNKIWEVLKSCNYNKTKAAQILNITRKTLYNKLRFTN